MAPGLLEADLEPYHIQNTVERIRIKVKGILRDIKDDQSSMMLSHWRCTTLQRQ